MIHIIRTHKIVGHIFGTNYEKYARTFVTLLGKGSMRSQTSWSEGHQDSFPSHTQHGIQRLVIQHWIYCAHVLTKCLVEPLSRAFICIVAGCLT